MPNTITGPKVQLPGGGQLQGFPALAAQTAACSATTNLLTQVAPLLAMMQCQSKVLNLLKPLIDVVKGLPNPPVHALQEFAKAANDLLPCLATSASVNQVSLARDLICLEIRALNCFLEELGAALKNPKTLADVLSSYEPIVGVLRLADGVFAASAMQPPQAPTLSGKTDAASIAADAKVVKAFVMTLQSAADSLGGCA